MEIIILGILLMQLIIFTHHSNRIKNFPYPLSKDDFDFSKSIANFQKTVKSSYENLEASKTKLQEDLKLAQDDLALKQTQITALEKTLADKQTEIQNVYLVTIQILKH
ncbi:MAG: hypothetical protein IPO16_09880 [Saprospiraceae bacterium]|nr:hypothetical protein [Saprospiraceae bacterium]